MLATAINFKSANANVNAIAVLWVGGNYEIIDFVVIIAKFWTNYCDSSLHRPKYTENKTNRVARSSVKSDRRLVGWLVGWRDEISCRRARGRTDGRTERRALRDGSTVRVETRRRRERATTKARRRRRRRRRARTGDASVHRTRARAIDRRRWFERRRRRRRRRTRRATNAKRRGACASSGRRTAKASSSWTTRRKAMMVTTRRRRRRRARSRTTIDRTPAAEKTFAARREMIHSFIHTFIHS